MTSIGKVTDCTQLNNPPSPLGVMLQHVFYINTDEFCNRVDFWVLFFSHCQNFTFAAQSNHCDYLECRRMDLPGVGLWTLTSLNTDREGFQVCSHNRVFTVQSCCFGIKTLWWLISNKEQYMYLYWFSLTFLSSLRKLNYQLHHRVLRISWVLYLSGYNKAVYSGRFNTWAEWKKNVRNSYLLKAQPE